MNCPHCGQELPRMTCQKCGKEIPEKSLFCCWCGNPVAAAQESPVDVSLERIPCSDGTCIGTLNEKGICNICGKPSLGSS